MQECGFVDLLTEVAQHIEDRVEGRVVLDSPFIKKTGTSQLALLSDEAYALGIQRIEKAISNAEMQGEVIHFHADIQVLAISGLKPDG